MFDFNLFFLNIFLVCFDLERRLCYNCVVSSSHAGVKRSLTLSLICLLWRSSVKVLSFTAGTQSVSNVRLHFVPLRPKSATLGFIEGCEWISMLTVITGSHQYVVRLIKRQTAVLCLTPGCRRIFNEAFGLFLKRNNM